MRLTIRTISRSLLHRGAQAAVPPVVALVPGVNECILSFKGDVDEIVRRTQAADATIVTEPAQQPWGYTGAFADPPGTAGW